MYAPKENFYIENETKFFRRKDRIVDILLLRITTVTLLNAQKNWNINHRYALKDSSNQIPLEKRRRDKLNHTSSWNEFSFM